MLAYVFMLLPQRAAYWLLFDVGEVSPGLLQLLWTPDPLENFHPSYGALHELHSKKIYFKPRVSQSSNSGFSLPPGSGGNDGA